MIYPPPQLQPAYNASNVSNPKGKRIDAIDALRAFTLLGIILAHTLGGFGFSSHFDFIDSRLYTILSKTIHGHFAPIFTLLFGCSFYLIINGKSYSPAKFVWRCVILFIIGMGATYFYYSDVLMRYAVSGILLVLFHKLPNKWLAASAIILILISIFIRLLAPLHDFQILNTPAIQHMVSRYQGSYSLSNILSCNPVDIIKWTWASILTQGILNLLAIMILGYLLAKLRVFHNIGKYANIRTLMPFLVVIAVTSVLARLLPVFDNIWLNYIVAIIHFIKHFSLSLSIAITFLIVYHHYQEFRLFKWMCKYGRLGLTNYVSMNVLGVVLFALVMIPCHASLYMILLYALLFYAMQTLFAVQWMRCHKFGPLEWLWRKATDFYPNFKNRRSKTM